MVAAETDQPVEVVLTAADGSSTRADGWLREFTPAGRARRAALVMLTATALAATLIPIPIIHLLGIPLVLLAGVVLAVRQLSLVARLRPLRMACPRCHTLNRIGGGLGVRRADEPTDRMCEGCRRILSRRIIIPG